VLDENETISRCLAGDGEVFELIVNRYQTQIFHLTWSILGDRDEAKDAAQEAFIRSFFRLKTFDRKKSFKTWLFSIAYNRCMDRLREKKTRSQILGKLGKENSFIRQQENPEKRIEESELYEWLLKKLNEKERTALSLKVVEGYSAQEISEVLGCKESTARVYLFNAKRKLKKILEKDRHV
jgi:RNA polymerase sigma-70 factor (ECF subfamily)